MQGQEFERAAITAAANGDCGKSTIVATLKIM